MTECWTARAQIWSNVSGEWPYLLGMKLEIINYRVILSECFLKCPIPYITKMDNMFYIRQVQNIFEVCSIFTFSIKL